MKWLNALRIWVIADFGTEETTTNEQHICPPLKQLLQITIECIQMVVCYLDIFVFEEFVLCSDRVR